MSFRLGRLRRLPPPCPECGGYGHLGYVRGTGRPIPCPECKGTGKAPSTPKAV
jgi:DnaJ-class molecular chaperone